MGQELKRNFEIPVSRTNPLGCPKEVIRRSSSAQTTEAEMTVEIVKTDQKAGRRRCRQVFCRSDGSFSPSVGHRHSSNQAGVLRFRDRRIEQLSEARTYATHQMMEEPASNMSIDVYGLTHRSSE